MSAPAPTVFPIDILIKSITDGKKDEEAIELIESGNFDLNQCGEFGLAPIHYLATNPVSLPLFTAICEHTANHAMLTEKPPFKGMTVLHLAVLKINEIASTNVFSNLNRCIEMDIDAEDISSRTPLALAASYKYLEVVSFLMNSGADPNKPSTRDSLLSLADKLTEHKNKKEDDSEIASRVDRAVEIYKFLGSKSRVSDATASALKPLDKSLASSK